MQFWAHLVMNTEDFLRLGDLSVFALKEVRVLCFMDLQSIRLKTLCSTLMEVRPTGMRFSRIDVPCNSPKLRLHHIVHGVVLPDLLHVSIDDLQLRLST